MLNKKTSVLSLMGKQVLDLEKGIFIGYVIDTYFNDDKSISGFQIIENDAVTTSFVDFLQVKHFQDDVVILDTDKKSDKLEGRSLFDVALVTNQGKLIAHIWDMAVDSKGSLQEVLLEKSTEGIAPAEYFTFSAEFIQKIGQDVIITDKAEDELLFEMPDKSLYQDLETGKGKSEYVESLFKKLSNSIEDISSRVKNLDKDTLSQEFSKLTTSLNSEVTKLFDGMMDRLNLRKKVAFDTDIDAIFRDLGGKTVSKPVCDTNGETIILPGQVITKEKIELVIENNSLADLYRLAVDFETNVNDIKIEE